MVFPVRQFVQLSVVFALIRINFLPFVAFVIKESFCRKEQFSKCNALGHNIHFQTGEKVFYFVSSGHKLATKMTKLIFPTPKNDETQQPLTPALPDELRLTTKHNNF